MSTTYHSSKDAGNGSLSSYLTGIFLALVLTAAPFWIVISGAVSLQIALPFIAGAAALQMIVHLVFFLHMNVSSGQRWNVPALLFTVLILIILVGGSFWIMNHLNHNMMPMMGG